MADHLSRLKTHAHVALSAAARLRRFFQKPKGLLILVLGALAFIAALGDGAKLVAPGLAAAVVAAVLVDTPILRVRGGKWRFPDGALLTGLIVGMILSPQTSWQVAALAAAIGVASKYLFRLRAAQVFNPAAVALVVIYCVYHSGQSWWGAIPDLGTPAVRTAALAVLLTTGLLVAERVRRIPAALAFLGFYFLLLTATAFLGDPTRVAALFRSSDLHAALFCAFFMVTDPPTSPSRPREQVVFGAIAAVFSYACSQLIGAVIFLLAGLLVANVWEAWRRDHVRAMRRT
jgi:Na+-translocating ferredoxin:NAD+ oxidoreductase RnfD subunit